MIDLSRVSEARATPEVSQSTALIQVIERAARDPSIDMDKLERLLAMQERIMAQQAKAAYADALSRLQPTLPIIGERGAIKNNSGAIQSTYALWEDIVGIITPLLAAQGFSISFRIGNANQKIQVTGVLAHREGHSEETTIDLPADTSGSKNAVQAVASSVSYGKRYTAGALLNLRTGDVDDDGRGAGNETPPDLGPRPDTSGIDITLVNQHVSAVADILAMDVEENDKADALRAHVDEHLNPFPELYVMVADQLARQGVISKKNFKGWLALGAKRQR
jgi:hypothetical protein